VAADSGVQVQHGEHSIRRVGSKVLPGLHDLRCVGPGPLEGVRRNLADGMRTEHEARDDPEVAATAPA